MDFWLRQQTGGNAIIIDKSHPIKPGIISTTGIYVEA
jgi:hypothetical protein